MIGKLTGKIDTIYQDSLIIDVGGVGYLVYASSRLLRKLEPGQTVSMLIETYVREELINLYGFFEQEEKDCFNKLTLVSGVGTKLAMTILSSLSPDQIGAAIATEDKLAFKQISGVGTKLAERIILELKGKIIASAFAISAQLSLASTHAQDAILALANLGINKNDATNVVTKIIQEQPSISIDEIIRRALQSRGG